jgi:hypothetical protein
MAEERERGRRVVQIFVPVLLFLAVPASLSEQLVLHSAPWPYLPESWFFLTQSKHKQQVCLSRAVVSEMKVEKCLETRSIQKFQAATGKHLHHLGKGVWLRHSKDLVYSRGSISGTKHYFKQKKIRS